MFWSKTLARYFSPRPNRKARRARGATPARPRVEQLEAREVFSANLVSVGAWTPQGPGPIQFAAVDGLTAQNNPMAGGIDAVALAPDGKTAFIAASGGGVWRTNDLTAANPTWQPLTDDLPSLSISDVAVNSVDPQIVVAGTGSVGSENPLGAVGLYVSTDGGTVWTQSGRREFDGSPIVSIALTKDSVRGTAPQQFIAVAVGTKDLPGTANDVPGGLFESRDGGLTWSRTQDQTGVLPANVSPTDLIEIPMVVDTAPVPDETLPRLFFAAFPGVGVFRSNDFATWVPVANLGTTASNAPDLADNQLIKIDAYRDAVSGNVGVRTNLYMGLVDSKGELTRVHHNAFDGFNWRDFGTPRTHEDLLGADGKPGIDFVPDTFVGLHSFGRGLSSFSIAANPRNGAVYVGGDTHPDTPSDAFNSEFSGRLFRGDGSAEWDLISGSRGPHADTRDLLFVTGADGNVSGDFLLETDEGGIYKRFEPERQTGNWVSLNGNLQIANISSVAFDRINKVYFAGTASDGTAEQAKAGLPTWTSAVTSTFGNDPFQGDRLNVGFGDTVLFATDPITGRAVRLSIGVDLEDGIRRDFNSSGQQVDLDTTVLSSSDELAETLFRSGLAGGDVDDPRVFHRPMELNAGDGTRIAVAGRNLYESTNLGRTLRPIDDPSGLLTGRHFTALAAGTPANAQVLYGAYGNLVGVRDAAASLPGAPFDRVFRIDGETDIVDIVIDPQNSKVAYLLTARNVYKVLDGGVGSANPRYVSLTGNLAQLSGDFRTLEIVITGSGPMLVVGGAGGVYLTSGVGDGTPKWEEIGLGLPNAVVTDLHFDSKANLLYAGTDGRGVWQIANPDFLGNRGILNIAGTAGNDTATVSLTADGTRVRVVGSDGTNKLFPLANIGEIRFAMGNGNDTITLDGTNGFPARPGRSTAPFVSITDTAGTDTLTFANVGKDVAIEKSGNNYRFLSADGGTTNATTANIETLPPAIANPLATLGHGIEQFLRETATLRVTPHIASELSGLGLLNALDGTSSLVRRAFEKAGVRFDELGTAIADVEALEQMLQAASSFGVSGASVNDLNGLVVNFKTLETLSGRGRLQAGQDQGFANVDLVADITADVLVDIQFGVTADGKFFVGTNRAAGAEITVGNLSGTVSGDARLGFLGVTVKDGTIASDPTANFEINIFDPGTTGNDNRLFLTGEFDKWSSANVNAVLLPGTNAGVPNLSIATTIDVALFKFSVFDEAKVNFTWNDFNSPAAFTVVPTLGTNSTAQQLIDFITVNAGQVVAALESLAGGLEAATGTQILDTEIPVLGKTIGEVLNAVAKPLALAPETVVATTIGAGTFRVDVANIDLGAAGVEVGRTVIFKVGTADKQGIVEAVDGSSFTVRPNEAGIFPATTSTTYSILRPGTIAEQFNGFLGNLNFNVTTLQELVRDLGAKLGIDLLSTVTVEGTGVNRFIKIPLDFAAKPLTFSEDIDFKGSIPLLDLQANAAFDLTVTPKFHVALGISLAANKSVSERFFIVKDDANEVQLDVSAELAPNATGRIGFLDISLGKDAGRSGLVTFNGSFGVNIVDPLSPTDTRITLVELVSNGLLPFSANVSGKLNIDGLAVKAGISNSGDLGQITLSLDGTKADQGFFDSVEGLAALPSRLIANTKGLDNFLKFDSITGLDIAAAIIQLVQELGTLSKAAVFTNPLPLINKSPGELLTLADALIASLGAPESLNTSDTSSTFASADKVRVFLESKLGTPVGLAVDSQSVRFTFGFVASKSKTLPLGFSLGTDRSFANVSAAGDLTATAKAGMTITLGVTTSSKDANGKTIAIPIADRAFLDIEGSDATTFGVSVNVNSGYTLDGKIPNPLQFEAAVGPIGVGVVDGRVLVRGGFSGKLQDLPGSPTDGKLTLGEIGKAFTTGQLGALFGTSLTGDVQAILPIDGNGDKAVTNPPGSADAFVQIAGKIQNFASIDTATKIAAATSANIPIDNSQLNATSVLVNVAGLDGLISNGLLSFSNLVEGFEDLLEWGQKLLGVNVLDVKLPIVGKSIRDGLNFFEGQPGSIAEVLSKIRSTVNASAAPATNAAVTLLAGTIAESLMKLPNVAVVGDEGKNGFDVKTKEDFFRVNTSGGKVTGVTFFLRYQPNITIGSSFDLGLDFLPFKASGAVGASVALDAFLGFGVDFTDGFFVKTDFSDVPLTKWTADTPEIKATVSVFADQDLVIEIGGLSFEADFSANKGSLTATVGIDLIGGSDKRITGSEFIQGIANPGQFVDLSFELGSHIDVPLKLAANSELPSLEGRFFFDIGNGGTVDISGGDPLGPTVAINDVKLNAGSFVDKIAMPLLEKLEIFSPFAKVVDAFTAPLPLLDRSIYDVLREQLVKNNNTGSVKALDFLVKIGDFIDSANSMAGSANGLFLEFGDIPLVGGTSMGGTAGTAQPGAGGPSAVGGGAVAVANVANPEMVGTAPGSKADVANIPGSGLPVIGNFLKDLGELGITFPVLKLGNLVKLVTGQTVDIVFVNLPELSVDVGFNSPNIPLFNFGIPYVADINVAASFTVDFGLTVNLSAGLDTRGLNSAGKRFFDGFYIGDFDPGINLQLDATDKERPEVVLSAALGIDVNAAVRLLGLEAGSITGHGAISGQLEVDLNDDNENNYPENPNDHAVPALDTRSPQDRKDGKLYLDEIGIIRESRDGRAIALFDFTGKILAELGLTLRALGGLFEKSYDFDFVIYEFENVLRPVLEPSGTPDLAFKANRVINGTTREALVLTRSSGTGTGDRANFAASNSEGGDSVQVLLVDKNNDPNDGYDIATAQPGTYTVDTTSITRLTSIPGTFPVQVTSQTFRTHTVTQPGADFVAQGVKVGQRVRYFSTLPTVEGETARFATITAIDGDSITFEPGILGATFDSTRPVSVLSGRETIRVKKGTTIEDFGPGETGGNFVADINSVQAIIVDGGSGTIGSFGAGDDELFIDPFFRGMASIQGGAGNDTILGGSGNDSLDGGDGDDVLVGGLGVDSILGGRGDDEIDGGDGNDTLIGDRKAAAGATSLTADGEGRDVISGGAGNDRIFGDNTLRSTGANAGANANDILSGGEGNDTITAGEGNDTVLGNEGLDRLEGEDGNDFLAGNDGNDTIFGGAGNDEIRGGLGNDLLFTGDANVNDRNGGIDKVRGNEETGIFLAIGTTSTGIDDDFVNGLDSEFFYYYGGEGHDTVLGSAKSDLVFGAAGGNDIIGGGGFDRITGSSKNDRIVADIGRIDGIFLPDDYLASLPPIGTGGDFIVGSGGADVIQNFSGDIVGNAVVGGNTNTNTPGVLDFGGATGGLNFNFDSTAPQNVNFDNLPGTVLNGGIVDSVLGSKLADNFTVRSGSRPRTVDGGLQPAGTKDTVTVNALGANVTIQGNQVLAAGFEPVTLVNVEAYSLTNTGGSITVVGTAGVDMLRLFAVGSSFRYELNGVEVNLGAISKFAFSAGAGNDRFILDFAGGNPIPAGGIAFTGASRAESGDALELRGTNAEVGEQVVAGAAANAGTITVGGRSASYSLTGEVLVGSFAKYTLTLEDDYGPVRVSSTADRGGAAETTIASTAVSVNHVALSRVPVAVLVLGPNTVRSPDNTVAASVTVAANALPASFTVQTGGGADTLAVEPGAGSFIWDAGTGTDKFAAAGDGDFSLRDDRLTFGTAAVLFLNSNVESFALTGGASANAFTLTNFSREATLDGGAGTDSVSLNLTGGRVVAVDPLTLAGNVATNASATAARIEGNYAVSTVRTISVADGTAAVDLILDSAIVGTGSLTFAGAGNRVLGGTPNYTGGSSLAAGTLTLAGDPGAIAQSGGTLAGDGTIASLTSTGGTIQPGTATTAGGLAITNSLVASAATTFAFGLHGTSAGRTYDAIAVTRGGVTLNGATLNVTLSGFSSAVGSQYTIIDNDGTDAVVGTFAGRPDRSSFTVGANTFLISYRGGTGNDVVLTHTNTASAFDERTIEPGEVGELIQLHGVPVDADKLDEFRLTVNWGDGSAPESFVFAPQTPEVQLGHRYARHGDFKVELQWTDQHGGGKSDTLVARVARPLTGPQSTTFVEPLIVGSSPAAVRNRDGSERFRLPAFDPAFESLIAVATGDVTGDGVDDVVMAAGDGGGPRVKVIDGATQETVADFFAYEGSFRGGVFVALGNLDDDPALEIVTGTGFGGGPRVRSFDLSNGTVQPVADFFAYDASFRGGVYVAVADTDGDGFGEIVTGTGPGGGPHVRVLDTAGTVLNERFAFDPAFRGGVSVGAFGDTLAVGAGVGGGPLVKLYRGRELAELRTLVLGDPNDRGGVRVGVADVAGDGDLDLIVTESDATTELFTLEGDELTL